MGPVDVRPGPRMLPVAAAEANRADWSSRCLEPSDGRMVSAAGGSADSEPLPLSGDRPPEGEPSLTITLDQRTVFENTPTDEFDLLFGEFGLSSPANDFDPVGPTSIEFVSGEGDHDNHRFLIDEDRLFLRQGEILDYETIPEYSIRVRVSDLTGPLAETVLTLPIEDMLEIVGVPRINDGSSQRSRVSSLTIEFDQPALFEPGAFRVDRLGPDGGPVDFTLADELVDGRTLVTLTFEGDFTEFDSLVDGNYRLTVDGSDVWTPDGRLLDAQRIGQGGEVFVFGATEADQFYRLFGDGNGSRAVGIADFGLFRNTFGRRLGDVDYNAAFDFDNNGAIGISDFGQFRIQFGERLTFG